MSKQSTKLSTTPDYTDADIESRLGIAVKEETLNRVYSRIPKDDLAQVLYHSADPKAIQLLEMLYDPGNSRLSFATLCAKVGLSLTEVLSLFRQFKIDEAMFRMLYHVPAVIEDVSVDAKSTQEVCPRCDGFKRLQVATEDDEGNVTVSERDCPKCKGLGEIRKPGDKDARALVFETAGLTGKRGPLIAQQFNINNAGDDFTRLVSVTEKAVKSKE